MWSGHSESNSIPYPSWTEIHILVKVNFALNNSGFLKIQITVELWNLSIWPYGFDHSSARKKTQYPVFHSRVTTFANMFSLSFLLQVFKEEMMHVFTRYINTHIQYNYRIFTMQICFLLSCITSYQEKLDKSRIPHLQAHILATGTHLAPRHIT